MSMFREQEEFEVQMQFAKGVLRLPPPYREAMILRHVADLPCRDVLRILMQMQGVGVEGARHILARGRSRLRELPEFSTFRRGLDP